MVTSKKGKVFGLRFHTTTTVKQLIDQWLLAPASYPDVKVLEGWCGQHDLVIIGDKGYVDADLEDRLWQTRRIQLLPLRRKNQKAQWPDDIRRILGRVRHRVETVFSTLTTVFSLESPRGRRSPAMSCASPPASWLIRSVSSWRRRQFGGHSYNVRSSVPGSRCLPQSPDASQLPIDRVYWGLDGRARGCPIVG